MNWDSWEDPKNSLTAAVTGLMLIRDCGEMPSMILGGHTLTNHSLQSGKTDAVLVLKQLTDGTDTTVAQMVDIVVIADAVLQMHVIVDGSNDILLRDMLRNQLMDAVMDGFFDGIQIVIFFQNFFKYRIIY